MSVEGRTVRGSLSVLLIGEGWPPDSAGGLNRYVESLHDALPEVGIRDEAVVIGPAESRPARVSVVPEGGMLLRLLRHLLQVHASVQSADVVDVHFALYGALPIALGLLRTTPVVVHFHGPWADESADSGAGRAAAAVKRAIEGYVYRRAARAIVLSEHSRALLLGYGVDPVRIHKVRPGVDAKRFLSLEEEPRAALRRSLGVPPGRKVVIAVRRLVPRMGLDMLVASWRAVQDAGIDAELRIIGDGPERESLQRAARAHQVEGTVHFSGKIDEGALAEWYAAADLAVTPSVQLEGFGLVLLEALASGTPVLASDSGGMREAVGDIGEGHLVSPVTEAAWSAALLQALHGERGLVERPAARAFAEASSWSATAAQVGEVYWSAVSGRRP